MNYLFWIICKKNPKLFWACYLQLQVVLIRKPLYLGLRPLTHTGKTILTQSSRTLSGFAIHVYFDVPHVSCLHVKLQCHRSFSQAAFLSVAPHNSCRHRNISTRNMYSRMQWIVLRATSSHLSIEHVYSCSTNRKMTNILRPNSDFQERFWKKNNLIFSSTTGSSRYCFGTTIESGIASNKSWMMPSLSCSRVQRLWGRSKIWEREAARAEPTAESHCSTNHTSGAPFPPKVLLYQSNWKRKQSSFLPANLANILLPPGEIVNSIGFQNRQ